MTDPRDDYPDMDDPLPALVAAVDQATKAAPLVAQIAIANYQAFMAKGFSDRQALYLTAVQMKENPGIAP